MRTPHLLTCALLAALAVPLLDTAGRPAPPRAAPGPASSAGAAAKGRTGLPAGIEPYDWALEQLRVPQAQRLARGRRGPVVAVIDLGYRHHRALDGRLWVNPRPTKGDRHGWDFADDDASLEFTGPQAGSRYYRDHHVFVAGEVAACAPGSPVMILRVGYKKHDSWHKAVRYAVDHGAKVIVMPHGYICRAPGGDVPLVYQGTDFAYPEDNPDLRKALDYAYDKGCLIFSGTAENNGRRVAYFPSSFEAVCAVGSTNRLFHPSQMASNADYVEFGAPAGTYTPDDPKHKVWGYGGDDNCVPFSGGCMAAGFAGGTAALVWSRLPGLTNEQLRQVLRNTARMPKGLRTDAEGRQAHVGFGILDAEAAASLKDGQLCRDVRLRPETVKVEARGGKHVVRAVLRNHGAFDAARAMVVAYSGDPTKPAAPKATFDAPAMGLSTVQLGHAIRPVRGLHEREVAIELTGPPPATLWFETYCLDRHDAGKVHRVSSPVRAK